MNISSAPSLPPLRTAYSPARAMPGDLRGPQIPMSPGVREAPSCVQNAMANKERKPFTYTPGGLDLSEIRSEKMARRLMINAMSPGVQEKPKVPVFTPTGDAPARPIMNYYNMPIPVFPCVQIPENAKNLLRKTSGPHARGDSIDRSPTKVIDKPFKGHKKDTKAKKELKVVVPAPVITENKENSCVHNKVPEKSPTKETVTKPVIESKVSEKKIKEKSISPDQEVCVSFTLSSVKRVKRLSERSDSSLSVTSNTDTKYHNDFRSESSLSKKSTDSVTRLVFTPVISVENCESEIEPAEAAPPIEIVKIKPIVEVIETTPIVETVKIAPKENNVETKPKVQMIKIVPKAEIVETEPYVENIKVTPKVECVEKKPNVEVVKIEPKANIVETPPIDVLKNTPEAVVETELVEIVKIIPKSEIVETEITDDVIDTTEDKEVKCGSNIQIIKTSPQKEIVPEPTVSIEVKPAEQDLLTVETVINISRPDSEMSIKSIDSDSSSSSSSYEYINFERPESALSSKSFDNELDIEKSLQTEEKGFLSESIIPRKSNNLTVSPVMIKTSEDDSSTSYIVESPLTSKRSGGTRTREDKMSSPLNKISDEDSTTASENVFSPVTVETSEVDSRPESANIFVSNKINDEELSLPRVSPVMPKVESEQVFVSGITTNVNEEESKQCATNPEGESEVFSIIPITTRLSVHYSRLANESLIASLITGVFDDDYTPANDDIRLSPLTVHPSIPEEDEFINTSDNSDDCDISHDDVAESEYSESKEINTTNENSSAIEIDTKQFESALLDFKTVTNNYSNEVVRREKKGRDPTEKQTSSMYSVNNGSNKQIPEDGLLTSGTSRRSSEAIKFLNDDLDNLPTLDICSKRFSFLMDNPLKPDDDPFNIPTGPPPKINLIGDIRSKPTYPTVKDSVPSWKQTQMEKSEIINTTKKKEETPPIESPWKTNHQIHQEKPIVKLFQELKKTEDFWKSDIWNKMETVEPEKPEIAKEDKEPSWRRELREIAHQKRQSMAESEEYKNESEHPWRKELGEISQSKETNPQVTSPVQAKIETKEPLAPPWSSLSPDSSTQFTIEQRPSDVTSPTWSQTLRPKTWKERNADLARDKEVEIPEWKKPGLMRRGLVNSFIKSSPDSSTYSSPARDTTTRKTPEITVEIAGQPSSVMAPPVSNGYTYPWESSPESSIAFSPEPMYDRTPTPQSRNSPYRQNVQYPVQGLQSPVISREFGQLSFQPNRRQNIRTCPIQSRSFKYLQLLTGTDDTYEDDEPFVPQPAQHAHLRPDNF